MDIPLLNLKRQYKWIEKEIMTVLPPLLKSGHYIMGEPVTHLEEKIAKYIGTDYAVSCANGTDALIMSLIAIGVGPDDEVITTPFTFFATAEAIVRVGAKPVFVDVCGDTFNIDPQKIQRVITKKTKAIIPVHLFGQPADMDAINTIAKENNLSVIEDACQSIGASYKGKKTGSLSDVGCFSFFPTKNLGACGDAGIITTDNEKIYKIIKGLRVHGSGASGLEAYQACQVFNEDKSNHSSISKYMNYLIGYNSRLDTIQAAILLVKLKYLDEWNNKRDSIAKYYNEHIKLKDIVKPSKVQETLSVNHLYVLQHPNRDSIIKYLKGLGISTGIYYPVPLHLQKVFSYLEYKEGDLPISEYLAKRTFAIPAGPELQEDEMAYIVASINQFSE